MEFFKKKLVWEFQERKKTLTTQVVRKSLLKKKREASSRVPIINIVIGAKEEYQRKKKVQPWIHNQASDQKK
jgi:hypothetical protein